MIDSNIKALRNRHKTLFIARAWLNVIVKKNHLTDDLIAKLFAKKRNSPLRLTDNHMMVCWVDSIVIRSSW